MAEGLQDGYSGTPEEPGASPAIECLPTVMEAIHAEVAEAFYSAPRGGVETGGVLYGVHEKSRLLILAARPLNCEHAAGPSFVLSAGDRARLEELLGAPQRDRNLSGMSVVGWYHSHTRGELDLTPQDLEIHDRYFPEPWQVALVLRPAAMRPTRVSFHYRGAGGAMRGSQLYREAKPAARAIEAPRAAPRSVVPAPVATRAVEPPAFLAVPAPARRRWPMWTLAAIAVCLLAAAAGYLTRDRWLAPVAEIPSGLRLQVTDRQGQLEIRWDGTLPLLRDATGGSLELLDGSTRRFILLDPKLLRSGSVNFARQADTVRIHLTVDKPDGSKVEELTSFLGRAPVAAPAEAPPDTAQQQAAEEAAAAERARLEDERKAALKREAKRREDEAKRLAAQKKAAPPPPKTAKTEPPPAPKPEPPASKPVTQTAKVEIPAPKPEPPAVKPEPVVSVPVTQTAKAEPPPLPKPEVQAPKPEPPAPKVEPPPAKPAAATIPAPAPPSLAGEWSLSRAVASGSPFRPEAVTLSLTEDGGWVRGTLSGRYRAPRSSGAKSDVSFSFGGPVRSGNMKFAWAAGDGSKGEIEFIRLPGNTESLEIVWYAADRKFVFDDVVVRTKKR